MRAAAVAARSGIRSGGVVDPRRPLGAAIVAPPCICPHPGRSVRGAINALRCSARIQAPRRSFVAAVYARMRVWESNRIVRPRRPFVEAVHARMRVWESNGIVRPRRPRDAAINALFRAHIVRESESTQAALKSCACHHRRIVVKDPSLRVADRFGPAVRRFAWAVSVPLRHVCTV